MLPKNIDLYGIKLRGLTMIIYMKDNIFPPARFNNVSCHVLISCIMMCRCNLDGIINTNILLEITHGLSYLHLKFSYLFQSQPGSLSSSLCSLSAKQHRYVKVFNPRLDHSTFPYGLKQQYLDCNTKVVSVVMICIKLHHM